jgi:DNA-binding response OmpR family regulator
MDKWKILVVAASNDEGDFLSTFLNNKGFDVTLVDTTRHIKEKYVMIYAELSRKKYDMVLLTTSCLRSGDIRALIPEIKKKHSAIKIFVLSRHSSAEFIKNVEGIDEFLTSPFTIDSLREKVTSIFDQKYKIKEAQKKLDWAALSYRKKFICEVIGYDRNNYRVRFSQRRGLITIESIPQKEIVDLKMGVGNSPYLEELFKWVRQVAEGKGKS